jgi:hypothetical protein
LILINGWPRWSPAGVCRYEWERSIRYASLQGLHRRTGTTSVLVCSALVSLMLGTAILAFTAWPGSDAVDEIGRVILRAPPSEADSASTRPDGRHERSASRRANGPAGARARHRGGPRHFAASPTLAEAPRAPGGVPQSPPTPGAPRGDGDRGTTPPTSSRPAPTTRVEAPAPSPAGGGQSGGLADTTGGLTDGLGRTAGGVSPELGRIVTTTGRTLSDLLRGLGASR